MRFYTSLIVCSVLSVFSASVATPQSALPLEGRWEGTLPADAPRGSRELSRRAPPPPKPVYFLISAASDGHYAGIWWLNSGASRPADIGAVALDGDAVRIDVPAAHGVWEGKLSSDRLTLSGEWRQSGKTTPLVLRRTGNANDPVTIERNSPGIVTSR